MAKKPPVRPPKPGEYLRPEISDAHTCKIGRVVVRWSKLEAAIEDTIWMFLGLDEDNGKLATKRLNADGKIQLLRSLGRRQITDQHLATEFNEVLKLTVELAEDRNTVIHGLWGTRMPANMPCVTYLDRSLEHEVISEEFSGKRMDTLSVYIQTTIDYLIGLPEKLGRPRRVPLK
jgi:hypothetical protein